MAQGFAVSVKLVDLATGPIGKINQAIAGIGKAISSANSVAQKSSTGASVAAKSVANTTAANARGAAKKSGEALYLIRDGLRDLRKQTTEVGAGFLKAFLPLETFGAAATAGGLAAGLGAITANFASAGTSLRLMSQSLGLNVVDLQTWRGAADLAGVGADSMTNSLSGLSRGIYMARNGLNPEMFRAAQQFGIDLNKGATDAERAKNVLLQYADLVHNNPMLKGNVQAQHTLAAVLGIDDKMIPLAQQGRRALEQYIEEAKKHGYITEQQAAGAQALQRAYTGLEQSITSTGYAIGAQIGQWLTPMLTAWTDWLDKVRSTPNLLGSVKKGFEDLANTDWAKVGENIVHALLGDGKGWQATGSKMMDWLTKGFNSAVPDFSEFVNKMTPVFANLAQGFGKAFAEDIEKAITDGIKNDPDLQTLIKVFQFPGQVHDAIFGPSGPDEDLRNRPAPGSWQEFFNNINPFRSWANGDRAGSGAGAKGGIPKNNPGNIRAPGGGFMQYNSLAEGMAALKSNLLAYEDKHGLNTLGGIINRWAPPNENPTAQLIQNAARRTGFGANQPIDLHDPAVMEKVANAIVVQEQGPARAKKVEEEVKKLSPGTTAPVGATTPPGGKASIPIAPLPSYVLPSFGPAAIPPAVAMPTQPGVAPGDMQGTTVPIPPRVPTSDGAGKQSALDQNSLHHFILDIRGATSGTKYAMNKAEGPATTDVRVQYSMDNLS